MAPAVFETQSVKIKSGKFGLRCSGQTVKFAGFMAVYKANDDNDSEEEENVKLPKLETGQKLTLKEVNGKQHFTQAPPRYTEAMLVKALEELGIGRPSTYSSIITTILTRGYVTKENKAFYTTELGEIVNEIMENNFEDIVDIDFSAKIESDLDKVEDGEIEWKELLRRFYPEFEQELKKAEENIEEVTVEDEKTDVLCENCGQNMVIKHGKYGKFLACPNFPECRNTKPFFEEAGVNCPICGGKVLIKKSKSGRKYFGCENNPECEFISWNKPTGEKCPVCGSYLVEKGSKKKRIACSNNECSFTKDMPENTDSVDSAD
jgi:DNA topoisomerase-1